MTKSTAHTTIRASSDDVWQLVGDFNATPDWHPAIVSSALENDGAVRRVQLARGGETIEELIEHDNTSRSYSYRIVESGLPVTDYTAHLNVDALDNGHCEVTWSCSYGVEGATVTEAHEMIQGFLDAGITALDDRWNQQVD